MAGVFGVDPDVLGKLRTFADYQQADQEFQLKKQLALGQLAAVQQRAVHGTQLPAALQLANEYQKRVAAGDLEGANTLAQFAKTTDKGIQVGEDGAYAPLAGYAQSVGGIAAQRKGMEQQATKAVDLQFNPLIQGAETQAKAAADAQAAVNKKQVQADNSLGVIDKILAKDQGGLDLLEKANGSRLGAAGAGIKGVFGVSDDATQANAQLAVYGNTLINDIPRMEGPQSDRDVALYTSQAGKIADPTVPAGDKRAALASIAELRKKYATPQNSGVPAGAQPIGTSGGKPVYQLPDGQWWTP